MTYTYEYPRPAVTVDCVVFAFDGERLRLLLIMRDSAPFRGCWALPGGFVREHESLEAAAMRELREETGLTKIFLEQLYTFGEPKRDPRGRVVTVAYYALIKLDDLKLHPSSDASAAAWFDAQELPQLAFDHSSIIGTALQRLKGKVSYQPIGFELLPRQFTLTQLQRLYEVILGYSLDKRNFRKKILSMKLLTETGQLERGVAHRAAALYRFDQARYRSLTKKGFVFEL